MKNIDQIQILIMYVQIVLRVSTQIKTDHFYYFIFPHP